MAPSARKNRNATGCSFARTGQPAPWSAFNCSKSTKEVGDFTDANPAAPNPTPMAYPPGGSKTVQDDEFKMRTDSNAAASSSGQLAFNANQIIKYAEKAFTGTGKDGLTWAASIFPSVKWTGDRATDTQLLGHSIALQTATMANQLGLSGSNAKMELSEQLTADGKWTEDSIKSSTRIMRALGDSATVLRNAGIENAAKTGVPNAVRDFKNNWSATEAVGGIDAFRLYDARRQASADPGAMKEVVTSLGGVNSDRYKQALKTTDKLGALVRGK